MLKSAMRSRTRLGALAMGSVTVSLGLLLFFSERFTALALPSAVDAGVSRMSALTVMLSGSRGILSELLWWRIGELQRQNRYTETAVLTDWLLTLEPSSPEVRSFNAWNLTYNISVAHDAPEDRWFWIRRGIRLLEEGIRLSPGDVASMRQLGWIFEDKIGGSLDTAAPYYRSRIGEVAPTGALTEYLTATGLPADTPLTAQLCALYWYDRAGDTFSALRVLSSCLASSPTRVWIERYIRAASQVWPELALSQRRQIRALLYDVLRLADSPAIRRFLEDHAL